MNFFNEKEFLELQDIYNPDAFIKKVNIKYMRSSFFNKMKKSVKRDRRGEVVFCVIRPNGKIVTITCKEYPEGIFRIPTGGICHNEDIIEAVYRETSEELGVEVIIDKFLGVLKIEFELLENNQSTIDSFMFYSYLFILTETGGRLLIDASDDEISEVREVDLEELRAITGSLLKISGRWNDWGKFRFETCNAIVQYFTEHCQKGDNYANTTI